MPYINLTTLEYPLTEAQVIDATYPPNTSIPRPFRAPEGYAEVQPAPIPEYDPITQVVAETDPALGDDGWVQTWAVVQLAPEQVAANTFAAVRAAVQEMLDTKAAERSYDGILSAATYVTSTVPKFAAEAQACIAWRDVCWDACYAILNEVQTGARPLPTVAQVLAEMPTLEWPL